MHDVTYEPTLVETSVPISRIRTFAGQKADSCLHPVFSDKLLFCAANTRLCTSLQNASHAGAGVQRKCLLFGQ